MHAFLETRSYSTGLPVNAFLTRDNHFLAHWHIDVEMVYVCEGSIRIGINTDSRILHQSISERSPKNRRRSKAAII